MEHTTTVQLCTSHGLDLLDEVHARLEQHCGGTLGLRIDRAPHVVQRVVGIVRKGDPSFAPADV